MKKLISDELYINGFMEDSLNIVALLAIVSGVFVIVSKNPVVSILFLIGLFLSTSAYLMILGINFLGLSYLLVYVGAVTILFLFILMLINIRISEIVNTTNNSVPLAIIVSILFFSSIYNAIPKTKDTLNNISEINNTKNIVLHNKQINNTTYENLLNGMYNNYVHKNVANNNISLPTIQEISLKNKHLNDSTYQFNGISIKPDFKSIALDNHSNGKSISLNITDALKNTHLPFSSVNQNQLDDYSLFLTYTQTWDCMLAETSHINVLGNILYTSYPIWLIITSIILLLAMVGAIVITLKN